MRSSLVNNYSDKMIISSVNLVVYSVNELTRSPVVLQSMRVCT